MNPAEAIPRPHLGLILVRALALLGLAMPLTLVVDLVLLALLPSLRDPFTAYFDGRRYGGPPNFDSGVLLEPALVVLFAFAVFAVLRRWRPRSLRDFVWLGLSVASIGVIGLVLAALFPPALARFGALVGIFVPLAPGAHEDAGLLPLFSMIVLPPLAVLGAAWWLRWSSWRWIGGGFLVIAPVFAYLAVDDPMINRPLAMAELSPAFSGSEESFSVLMRYGKEHPLGRDFKFQPPDRIYTGTGIFSPADPEWSNWLLRNRADLEADWLGLAPVWAWWNELNAFDRIGDLTPTRADAEIISFQPIRAIDQHACAVASLQALDGHGDEAFATLLPVLQVNRKLEPSARTLVRFMIARIGERMAMTTAGFVLNHTPVSSAAKAKFATALAGNDGVAGVRRIFAIQYAWWIVACTGQRVGDLVAINWNSQRFVGQGALNLLSPFLYNPRHTTNVLGEVTAELQDLAARREPKKLDTRSVAFSAIEGGRLKNRLGSALVINHLSLSYERIVDSYWKGEDERSALRSRLMVAATP